MRYLHPVQAHERFIASGRYRFSKNGEALEKAESWTMHKLPDGEKLVRVDVDAWKEEGKSILAEALLDAENSFVRLDVRYENDKFEGGINNLRATYQKADASLQIGFSVNGKERQYREVELPDAALIDIPLLVFRGSTIRAMAEQATGEIAVYVPMFEHAQLLPGVLRRVVSPVERVDEGGLSLGKRFVPVSLYRYRDKAAVYWIDQHELVVKRMNSYKQQEFAVEVSNYAAPAG